MIRILEGDCREVMRTLDAASIDAIVCDPPYELGFMGKAWDATGIANDVELWRAALRVLKPGGHLLAFSGTRTYHRMVCAIEDAGFEIRDQIGWLYGSGFPKSLDVSKAIDKAAEINGETVRRIAAVAEVIRTHREIHGLTRAEVSEAVVGTPSGACWNWEHQQLPSIEMWPAIKRTLGIADKFDGLIEGDRAKFIAAEREVIAEREATRLAVAPGQGEDRGAVQLAVTAGATVAARQWQGWGTALKPAWEPIVLARKPLVGTVAANVLQHGTGALNIDGCRVDSGGVTESSARAGGGAGHEAHNVDGRKYGDGLGGVVAQAHALGRWPANIIHDGSDEVLAAFPQAGGAFAPVRGIEPSAKTQAILGEFGGRAPSDQRDGGGSAARFFYTAKANGSDRNDGGQRVTGADRNTHPTVKPTDLMRYLCRLVTPPGGTVLDPFMGSGSTLKAAELEGFSAIGIELDPAYIEIARRRIASDAPLFAEVA